MAKQATMVVAATLSPKPGVLDVNEIVFEVTKAFDGGYDARAFGQSIFTQGNDWVELKEMVRDAVLCHFDEEELPAAIRLRLVRDEIMAG